MVATGGGKERAVRAWGAKKQCRTDVTHYMLRITVTRYMPLLARCNGGGRRARGHAAVAWAE